jgi:putative methyltransferase (TIGR04325 family)
MLNKILSRFLKNNKEATESLTPVNYSSFEEATAACNNNAYQNEQLVKVVVEKNRLLREAIATSPFIDSSAFRTLVALCNLHSSEEINVLDFGGGGGYHYSIVDTVMGKHKKITWHVIETAAMAQEAQLLANNNLKFFDNLSLAADALGTIDLLFTSSALQYCPNPLEHLRKLVNVNAKYLFITRTPFNDVDQEIIEVQESYLSQNGPGPLPSGYQDQLITYPITYASRQSAEHILKEKYDVLFKTRERDEVFSTQNSNINTDGYFCVRKSP